MKKQLFTLKVWLWVLVSLIPSMVFAQTNVIDTAHSYPSPIGQYLFFHQEVDTRLNPLQVLQKFDDGELFQIPKDVVNLGLGVKPVWIVFEVNHASTAAVKRYLTLEAPWLEQVDTYFIVNKKVVRQFKLGDAYPFSQRPIDERFLSLSYDFQQGKTTVLARLESLDPIVVPLFFSSELEYSQRSIKHGYFYGLLYGALLSLLAYNFFLYISLRLKQYLFYSIHIVAFIMTNMAYTGHAFQWLWPQSVVWQQWSNPILMVAFGSSGILFATQFLNSQQQLPRIHQVVVGIVSLFYCLLLFAVVSQNQVLADNIALAFIFCYTWILIVMGGAASRKGNAAARYLIMATVTAGISASVSILAVWNKIEYSDFRFRFVEIGMVTDAVLLSLALAYFFRQSEDKIRVAETLARKDPLTSLNNRRAFNEYAAVIWNNAIRQHEDLSIIMLDIDYFKVINDTYGHSAGDNILIQLSVLLQSENRAGDILARWGGEEFIVLLPHAAEADAVAIAERLRQQISALPFSIANKTIHISCSFGVASKSNLNETIENLIAQSDHALYHAKHSGRNRVSSSQDAHPLFKSNNTAI